jgi:hypothetical protein
MGDRAGHLLDTASLEVDCKLRYHPNSILYQSSPQAAATTFLTVPRFTFRLPHTSELKDMKGVQYVRISFCLVVRDSLDIGEVDTTKSHVLDILQEIRLDS